MKKTSKKRHVFRRPKKSCFFSFLEGAWANLGPKIRFWTDLRFSWGPKIRRHQPVSGVSDKRSQHCEAPPSEACPPYLPASTRGIKMASKIIILRFIFGIKFWHHFWHTFFSDILRLLVPLWLLLGILDAFWPPFWFPFVSLLLQICIPFSNLVFVSILHRFFINFEKTWKINDFRLHFGIILGAF